MKIEKNSFFFSSLEKRRKGKRKRKRIMKNSEEIVEK
jgi:hypothetical protein